MLSNYNMPSDKVALTYLYNGTYNQHCDFGNNQTARSPQSDMSTMSSASNPGTPDSFSMPFSSPSVSVTLSPESMENFMGMSMEEKVNNNIKVSKFKPYLVVREEPHDKYRFRYKSEMMGSHGCMLGRSSDKRKKFFPSVQLMNFEGSAIIRCSLYTAHKNESQRTLHCHRLVVKVGKDELDDPHQKPVDSTNGHTAVFPGMGIIHTAKKYIAEELIRKKRFRLLELYRAKTISSTLSQNEEAKIRAEAELEAKTMNLNVVSLGFEALVYDVNGILTPICKPIFSENICNMKSALTGELKICRIDRHFSSCLGGDEVWMLVEKVGKKNIKVKFYEMDEDDNEIWYDYGKFSELDVHHQYAIVFRTPPYRYTDIEEQRDVLVQLYRPTDGECSEPIRFTYRPVEKFLEGSRKRARLPSTDLGVNMLNGSRDQGVTSPYTDTSPLTGLRNLNAQLDPMLMCINNSELDLQADTSLLHDIDLLSVNSTSSNTFEQLLKEHDGMESAEFKDFLNHLSLEDYLATYQPGSMELTTDGGKTLQIGRKCQKSKVKDNSRAAAPVNLTVHSECTKTGPSSPLASKVTPMLVEEEKPTPPGLTPYELASGKCHLSGDQLIQIVMNRMNMLMTKSPVPSPTEFAMALQKLFDFTSDSGDTVLHVAVKPENQTCLDTLLSIINNKIRTTDTGFMQEFISDILNYLNKKHETSLHRAVLYNNPEAVAALLRNGASPNIADIKGATPLHMAVLGQCNECLKQLLTKANYKNPEQHAYLNTMSEDGYAPLHLAVRMRNLEAVKLLVSAGANVNEKDQSYGRAPIHFAVEEEDAATLRYLCSQPNISVNEPNFVGNTALHVACVVGGSGSLELCKILIEAKANPRIANYNVERNTDDDAEPQQSSSSTIVKEEYDLQDCIGQTSFDLAADKESILEYLHSLERTEHKIKTEPIGIDEEEECKVVSPKEEALSLIEMFDGDTLQKVCEILNRTHGWKRLAQLLDYSFFEASLKGTPNPTRVLFNYADLHGNISLDRIRSHLSILDENEAVEVIDEMLTRRFLAVNDT